MQNQSNTIIDERKTHKLAKEHTGKRRGRDTKCKSAGRRTKTEKTAKGRETTANMQETTKKTTQENQQQ